MVAKAKTNLGKIPCPTCREPVALMRADSGTLSYKCQEAECEATGFAQAHTAAARKWLAALPAKPAAAPPAPVAKQPLTLEPQAPAKPTPPVPEQPPRKGGFSISELG